MGSSYKESRIRDADRPLVLFLGITAVLLVLAAPWLRWYFQSPGDVVTAVYNKTVPDASMHHHGGVMWFLKHMKMPTPEGTPFRYQHDYYGFFPEGSGTWSVRDLEVLPENTDILYIADTYGVYKGTFGYPPREPGTSNLIYGGLTLEDLSVMREFLNRERPTTLIAEYNTFGSPTHPAAQMEAYEMFRTRWTGWTGQYMADLSREGDVHEATVNIYETAAGRRWEYSGPGFVFVEDEKQVMVMTLGDDIGPGGNQIRFTDAGTELLPVSRHVRNFMLNKS